MKRFILIFALLLSFTGLQAQLPFHIQGGINWPSESFLLDTFSGAYAAFDYHKLREDQSKCFNIRRNITAETADVHFNGAGRITLDSLVDNFSGSSTASNLGEFLASATYTDVDSLGSPADGFVAVWYDQTTNGNDAPMVTQSVQPQIASAGVILVDGDGNVAQTHSGDSLALPELNASAADYTMVTVTDTTTPSSANHIIRASDISFIHQLNNASLGSYYDGTVYLGTNLTATGTTLSGWLMNYVDGTSNDTMTTYQDGSIVDNAISVTNGIAAFTASSIGRGVAGLDPEFISSIVIFDSVSLDIDGVNANINARYSIY